MIDDYDLYRILFVLYLCSIVQSHEHLKPTMIKFSYPLVHIFIHIHMYDNLSTFLIKFYD